MKIKSKANIDGGYYDFEFEGTLDEIDELTKSTEKIKESIKLLTTNDQG